MTRGLCLLEATGHSGEVSSPFGGNWMPTVIGPPGDLEDPASSGKEWRVVVTVPVEFTGVVIGELTSRAGQILALDRQGDEIRIRARLPIEQYEHVARFVAELAVPPAKVELEPDS